MYFALNAEKEEWGDLPFRVALQMRILFAHDIYLLSSVSSAVSRDHHRDPSWRALLGVLGVTVKVHVKTDLRKLNYEDRTSLRKMPKPGSVISSVILTGSVVIALHYGENIKNILHKYYRFFLGSAGRFLEGGT
jgi:hypothetical protein